MNNPASSGGPIAALALTPPYIPRQTYPIIHPVAQVGLSRLNYYADPLGLLVLFGPYQGQVPNETGRVFINGSPAPIPAEITKDSTSPLEFRVPAGMLLDGVNTIKVSLQRQSGNEDSSELSVLHYLNAPAGNDTDPNPGNSLLSIDVTPMSIGQAEAIAGVSLTMSYPRMALYDLLTINYGGKTLTHQLVPTPPNPNPEKNPIVLTFKTADFAHDPDNRQFVFKYNVINQVGDFSGTSSMGVFNPQEFWSKDCVVDVHLDWAELQEAILQEILGDNGDDPAIVDLGKMNGGPLWALIHLINPIWQAGDEIHLIFEAWLNGLPVANYEVTLPIGQVPGQMAIDIPNAKVVTGSQITVKYQQIRSGKVIGVSKVAMAQVINPLFERPRINNIFDQNGEKLPQDATTTSNTLTLKGNAAAGKRVRIVNNDGITDISLGTETADSKGQWQFTDSSLSGKCQLFARALYSSIPTDSNKRNVFVFKGHEDFQNESPRQVYPGETVRFESGLMLLVITSGGSFASGAILGRWGAPAVMSVQLNAGSTCVFKFEHTVHRVSFKFRTTRGVPKVRARFMLENKVVFEEFLPPGNNEFVQFDFESAFPFDNLEIWSEHVINISSPMMAHISWN